MKANTRNQEFQDDKVAAIGIGAMIVFIALILVAAVAAAVIIQTAEALQQNAQQTGDDTADNMAGKVMINAAYVDGTTGYKLFVRLAPGSEPAPTNAITYQLMCPGTLPVEGAVGNVELMDGSGVAVATMQPSTGYTMILSGTAGALDCTAATVGTGGSVQAYIHVGSGGTTFETLSLGATAAGSKVV